MIDSLIYNIATHSNVAKRKGIENLPDFDVVMNILSTFNNIYSYLEEMFGEDLCINSWFRSKELNDVIGGSPKSKHMQGLAIDFYVKNISIIETATKCALLIPRFHKIIMYPIHGFIHIDYDFYKPDRKAILVTYDKKEYSWVAVDEIKELI